MSKRITIKCRNCGDTVRYNLRNGSKPAKVCNDCDKKKANIKRDLSEIISRSKKARFMEMY